MHFNLLKSKLGCKRFNNVVHISHRFGYVYISNPKAACSTIKLYLAQCEQQDKSYKPKTLHRRRDLPFFGPNQLSINERKELFDGNFFVFTFVRHPLKRAVSAYNDKIVGNKPQKREVLKQLGRNPEAVESHVKFDEFVYSICSQEPSSLNPHWRPQFFNLYPDIIQYDFIGHLEFFDRDFGKVKNMVGLPEFLVAQQNVKSRSINLAKYLSQRNRFRLARLYAKDFIEFGYRPKGIEYLGVIIGCLHPLRFQDIRGLWSMKRT